MSQASLMQSMRSDDPPPPRPPAPPARTSSPTAFCMMANPRGCWMPMRSSPDTNARTRFSVACRPSTERTTDSVPAMPTGTAALPPLLPPPPPPLLLLLLLLPRLRRRFGAVRRISAPTDEPSVNVTCHVGQEQSDEQQNENLIKQYM